MTLSVQLAQGVATETGADALIVGVFAGQVADSDALLALEDALGGGLLSHLKASEFDGKLEQTQDVPTFGRVKSRRLLVVGLGAKGDLDTPRARTALAAAVRIAQSSSTKSIALALPQPLPSLRAVGEAVILGAYKFSRYFTGDRKPKAELAKVTVLVSGKVSAEQKKQLETGVAIGRAVCIARDAVNEPPNELYPETLAQIAQRIAKENGFKVKVLDKKGILAAGMLLHYAVGQGSTNEPRFIHLSYVPKKKKKKVVFVGKGLTFDSGGLCIKPAAGMGEMKSDMGGAAAVLGLMAAIGVVKPDIELHVLVGAAENMPDGSAYRPGDVIGSLDGKTVEIINTDAEGRLVLADALAYAVSLKPDVIVDAATLTGAALVALGKTCSAFYATEEGLAEDLQASAKEAGELFWRMPLLDELGEQLKSDVADLKHTGDRYGGSITAALFLREFVGKVPWVHCDIAGPVLAERARGAYPKGGTGHAVLTFLNFVERLAR
ncbi:MAG: Cytosol aminopeptidase PepA [Polyangiaceae bacterium]|jgi:leucyl aminopeptidase|nr:Cytosol aminopeptidase PepA [Polyangiaceae bacterium]